MTAWFSLSSLWIVARSPHCCRIGDRQLPVVQLYRDIPIAREGRIVVNADGVNRSALPDHLPHTPGGLECLKLEAASSASCGPSEARVFNAPN